MPLLVPSLFGTPNGEVIGQGDATRTKVSMIPLSNQGGVNVHPNRLKVKYGVYSNI